MISPPEIKILCLLHAWRIKCYNVTKSFSFAISLLPTMLEHLLPLRHSSYKRDSRSWDSCSRNIGRDSMNCSLLCTMKRCLIRRLQIATRTANVPNKNSHLCTADWRPMPFSLPLFPSFCGPSYFEVSRKPRKPALLHSFKYKAYIFFQILL